MHCGASCKAFVALNINVKFTDLTPTVLQLPCKSTKH